MQGYHELLTAHDRAEAASLLCAAGLSLPLDADFGLGFYEDGRLQAVGFLAGDLLCGLTVVAGRRGQGLSSSLAGRLMAHGREAGRSRFLLITKAEEADKFAGMGFAELARTKRAAFLEFGRPGYADWIEATRGSLHKNGSGPLGAVVMNANPFTLGHRHLVETAVRRAGRVAVFVVAEDASAFPFAVRLALARQGLADLERVIVLSGGPYMVSRGTFPSYFTGEREHAAVHAALDAALFAERIAPDLGVSVRFIGTEPLCGVTSAYNAVLLETLPPHGIGCVEVARLERCGAPVSASRVRALLRQDVLGQAAPDWRAVAAQVPQTTLAYLQSAAADPVLERLVARCGAQELRVHDISSKGARYAPENPQ